MCVDATRRDGGSRLTNRLAARWRGIWKKHSRFSNFNTTGPPPPPGEFCPAFRRGKRVTVASPDATVMSRRRGAVRGSREAAAAPAPPLEPSSSEPVAGAVHAGAKVAGAPMLVTMPAKEGKCAGPCGGGENSGIEHTPAKVCLTVDTLEVDTPVPGAIRLRSLLASASTSICATCISMKVCRSGPRRSASASRRPQLGWWPIRLLGRAQLPSTRELVGRFKGTRPRVRETSTGN